MRIIYFMIIGTLLGVCMAFAQTAPPTEPADLNKDGAVTTIDVLLFSYTFGERVEDAPSEQIRREIVAADFIRDARIDELDLFYILSKWKPKDGELEKLKAAGLLPAATDTLQEITPQNPPQSQNQQLQNGVRHP